MANVVVIGSQWGDEGKGKIVDWLSERADVVVRFQGGHNAGHTLVIDGVTYKLSLLPSGVVRRGKLAIIGNGVVLDPWALLAEIDVLKGQGVEIGPDNVRIEEVHAADRGDVGTQQRVADADFLGDLAGVGDLVPIADADRELAGGEVGDDGDVCEVQAQARNAGAARAVPQGVEFGRRSADGNVSRGGFRAPG